MKKVICLCISCIVGISANGATFQGLGEVLGDFMGVSGVSNNGVVTGTFSNEYKAIVWTETGGYQRVAEPYIGASTDVTANGSYTIGYVKLSNGNAGFKWNPIDGLTTLPYASGQDDWARAHDVSGDGLYVVGHTRKALGTAYQAMMWDSSNNITLLGDLPGGIFQSIATAIENTGNGPVAVGYSESLNGNEAFRWDSTNGMVGLGDLTGGGFYSSASDISGDGSTIIGTSESAFGNEAFRWDSSNGMVGLGDLEGGDYFSEAYSVSSDGRLIVGASASAYGNEAFIWDAIGGMRNLKSVLEYDYNLDLSGWTLTYASTISPDGLTIAGWGINPNGAEEAWIATVPEPVTLSLLVIGGLMLRKRK